MRNELKIKDLFRGLHFCLISSISLHCCFYISEVGVVSQCSVDRVQITDFLLYCTYIATNLLIDNCSCHHTAIKNILPHYIFAPTYHV